MARQYGSGSEKGRQAEEILKKEKDGQALSASKIEHIVSYVFIAAGVLALVWGISGMLSYNNKTKQVSEAVIEAQTAKDSLQTVQDNTDALMIDVDVLSASASDAGNAVCSAQNAISSAQSVMKASGVAVLTDAHQAALDTVRQYFSSDQSKMRDMWCEYGVWEFNGTYQFEGSTMTVVWKCYASDDTAHERLLALAVADYDSSDDAFHNGKLYYTSWYGTAERNNNDSNVTADQSGTYTGEPDPVSAD